MKVEKLRVYKRARPRRVKKKLNIGKRANVKEYAQEKRVTVKRASFRRVGRSEDGIKGRSKSGD